MFTLVVMKLAYLLLRRPFFQYPIIPHSLQKAAEEQDARWATVQLSYYTLSQVSVNVFNNEYCLKRNIYPCISYGKLELQIPSPPLKI